MRRCPSRSAPDPEASMARKPAAAVCVTVRSPATLNLASPGRWPDSVARMDGPNGAPGFATGAPTRLSSGEAKNLVQTVRGSGLRLNLHAAAVRVILRDGITDAGVEV